MYTSGLPNTTESGTYGLSGCNSVAKASICRNLTWLLWIAALRKEEVLLISPDVPCRGLASAVIGSVCISIKCEKMQRARSEGIANPDTAILIKLVLLVLTNLFFFMLELNTSMGKIPCSLSALTGQLLAAGWGLLIAMALVLLVHLFYCAIWWPVYQ